MKFCGKCGARVEDSVKFCTSCGEAIAEVAEKAAEQKDFSTKVAALNDTADTTADFDVNDIAQNKVMGVLAYFGPLCLVPILAAKDSKFARFHANQGLVLFIVGIILSVLFVIPLIGWILAPILSLIVTVLAIIGIINAAGGKAKELPIIGKYKLLK